MRLNRAERFSRFSAVPSPSPVFPVFPSCPPVAPPWRRLEAKRPELMRNTKHKINKQTQIFKSKSEYIQTNKLLPGFSHVFPSTLWGGILVRCFQALQGFRPAHGQGRAHLKSHHEVFKMGFLAGCRVEGDCARPPQVQQRHAELARTLRKGHVPVCLPFQNHPGDDSVRLDACCRFRCLPYHLGIRHWF